MLNERIKMAESIDTVHTHTHTHTHHILTNRIGGQSGERELHFSEIKYSLFSDSIFTLDSSKPIVL